MTTLSELRFELKELLVCIVDGRATRDDVSAWLASKSWAIYESADLTNRIIVADLDAILTDIDAGRSPESELGEVAASLEDHLEGLGR